MRRHTRTREEPVKGRHQKPATLKHRNGPKAARRRSSSSPTDEEWPQLDGSNNLCEQVKSAMHWSPKLWLRASTTGILRRTPFMFLLA